MGLRAWFGVPEPRGDHHDPKLMKRLAQLPRRTVVAYLNTSLYETGRALTAYEAEMTEENYDEVEHCASLIPDLVAELRRRHDEANDARV